MRNKTLQFISVFVLGGLAGIALYAAFSRPATRSSQLRDGGGFQFINPILLCSASDGDQSVSLANMRSAVSGVVSRNIKTGLAENVGVYYSELSSSQWFGVNENEKFTPGSLLKVPVLMTYLKKSETDPSYLKKEYSFSGADDQDALQNFKPEEAIKPNKNYTTLELLDAMISDSDNNAAQILMQHLDGAILDKTYEMLKFSPPDSPLAINFVSPKTFSYFLRVTYNASYLSRETSEQALAMLSKKNFVYGIRSGIPSSIVVADKFGERVLQDVLPAVNELHDCGIVYYPGSPYLLCVMTRGPVLANLPAVIKDVSATVYELVNAKYKRVY